MEYTVNHYPDKHRFEVVEDGLTAYAEYRLRGDALTLSIPLSQNPWKGVGLRRLLLKQLINTRRNRGCALWLPVPMRLCG